ncbi:uncharacterized protein GIQ15_02118 [Arthroderma uncinatum]|uniref:uncharacterized protein n=1 Tax=Arthroderma uncinatum TaxID=74035 RepID=UPI00144A9EEF|nr:uncharacterized protein GIQ15_02118 [Arthroderma uncinatum]KAF3482794.1 hypothetical protein GIQ15_02118 [Arthroderma uncinatum]
MCRLISNEHYLACSHIVPCHLRHPVQRCHAPNGIRFRNPDPKREPDRIPSWTCSEESWVTATIDMFGSCPACVEERGRRRRLFKRLNEIRERGSGRWTMHEKAVGTIKMYSCGHQQVYMRPDELQSCFSPCLPVAGDGRIYRVSEVVHGISGPRDIYQACQGGGGGDGQDDEEQAIEDETSSSSSSTLREDTVFSWRRWEQLPLSCETSTIACPDCRRRASLVRELAHRGLARRKPPLLLILSKDAEKIDEKCGMKP